MNENNSLTENLESCFWYRNLPIQTLTTVSLSLSQNHFINISNKNNNKILKKLNENRIMEEKKNFLLNNRVFYILSTIESLLSNTNFKDFMDFKDTKEKSRKKINTNLLKNFYPKIIESFLYRKIISRDFLSLEKKKVELIEISCEIKKNFLILDLLGLIDFNETINDFNYDGNNIGTEFGSLILHLFRKMKNFKSFSLIENDKEIVFKIDRIFQDKTIKKTNLNKFFAYFLDDNLYFLKHWYNPTKIDSRFFFKWIVNFFQFKIGINMILNTASFLPLNEKIHSYTDEKCLIFDSNFLLLNRLKKMGKNLKNFHIYLNFSNFVSYGETISSVWEITENDRENFLKKENIEEIKTNFHSNFKISFFRIFGFVYFQKILKGIIILRKYLEYFKSGSSSIGFEHKILFAIGLLSHKNYSEKISNFIIKKIKKKDFKKVLSSGNHMIFKNLVNLCLAVTFSSPHFMRKRDNVRLKIVEEYYIKWVLYKFQKKKIIHQILFPKNLTKKKAKEFNNKLLVIFLISLCIVQNRCMTTLFYKFLTQTIHLIKLMGNISILNREQDLLIKFIPLIFGIQMLEKKGDINLFNKNLIWDTETEITTFPFTSHDNIIKKNFNSDRITLQLCRNKFLQQICARMIQYCAFMGTAKKELVKMTIKDIKLFESIRVKKSERMFIIQEKYKKSSVSPIFFSIYDLNVFNELDRSFIYFKTSIEISILGLSLLTFGNDFVSKLIYRIQSFFLSNDYIQYSSCALVSISFLFASNKECTATDFIVKLLGSTDFITIKNSVFTIGLIGSGTNSTKIKNALKCLAKFYKSKLESAHLRKRSIKSEDDFQFFRKIKSIFFLIRLSQGMVNSFYKNLSQVNPLTGKLNKSTTGYFLITLFSFMVSNFIGEESIFPCFFLLNSSFNSKLICTFDENFLIRSLRITNHRNRSITSTHLLTPCYISY